MKNLSFLKLITPLNINEEKDKFFSVKNYNPQFKYFWEENDISEYINEHKSKKALLNAILKQDAQAITQQAQTFFETKLQEPYLSRAKEITKNVPEIQKNITIDEVKESFQDAINKLGLGYIVEIDERSGFSFRPRHFEKKLMVSKSYQTQFASLDSSIRHEITHIIRYINWKHNKIKRPPNFLPTEEGLASFMGDFHSDDNGSSYFQHAAEYLATEVSLKSSFSDVFEFLKSLKYKDEVAWNKTVRHKLGFINTNLPGDIMKPAMYFYFEEKIRQLSTEELIILFVGKINLDQIKEYDQYFGKVEKERIINFFGLE